MVILGAGFWHQRAADRWSRGVTVIDKDVDRFAQSSTSIFGNRIVTMFQRAQYQRRVLDADLVVGGGLIRGAEAGHCQMIARA